jgi:hypothetical protein
MSPLPNPTPIRRTILRIVFSPAALLCGFIVLVISTCPGARGDTAIEMLAASGGLSARAGGAEADRGLPSAGHVRTSVGRGLHSSILTREDMFPRSRSTLPLLVAPLPGDVSHSPSAAPITPMKGPAVGVPRKLPVSHR